MVAPPDFGLRPEDVPPVWSADPPARTILVTGRDRNDFLRRILSGRVPPVSGVSRTALLTPKGALVAAATASATANAIVLETGEGRRDTLLSGLDRYRIADDVELVPLDGGPDRTLLFQGFGSHRAIEGALDSLGWRVPDDLDFEAMQPGRGVDLPGDGPEVAMIRRLFRPWPTWRLRLLFAATGLDAFTGRRGAPARRAPGVSRAGSDLEEYLRIAAGEPAWGQELNESSRVPESGLAAHARLGQGCYIGQEYVARQVHRGRIPRLLRRLAWSEAGVVPDPGALLHSGGRRVGRLTSARSRPAHPELRGSLPALGLAILNAAVGTGAVVTAAGETGSARGRVLAD